MKTIYTFKTDTETFTGSGVAKKIHLCIADLLINNYINPCSLFTGSCKFKMQLIMALDFSEQLKKSRSSNENSVIN